MHVLFVAPHFPSYQRHFVRAMHSVGAKVTGIGEASLGHLDGELKSWMVGYEQVPSVCDEQAMLDAVRRVQRRSYVDRLETTIEAHILPTAAVREATGIPGLSVKAAVLCRDKPQMKEHLRAHGIPCAASDGIDSVDAAVAFVRQHGYPIIIKPRAGAGASGTSRCDNDGQLAAALKEAGVDRGQSVAIEEFIEGHEGFYDTMSVNGVPVMEFVSHYYPNVLDAMRKRLDAAAPVETSIQAPPLVQPIDGLNVLRALDLSKTIEDKQYDKELEEAERRLSLASRDPRFRRTSVVAVFEGSDAAGKGVIAADNPYYEAAKLAFHPDRAGDIYIVAKPYQQLEGTISLGVNHGRLGHQDLALTYLRDAVAQRRRQGRPDALAQALALLGNAQLQAGEPRLAGASHREAIALLGPGAAPTLRARRAAVASG